MSKRAADQMAKRRRGNRLTRRARTLAKDDSRLAIDVPEAGALLGLSRNGAYQAAAAGTLPTIRVGRRILVPRAALMRLLEGTANPLKAA